MRQYCDKEFSTPKEIPNPNRQNSRDGPGGIELDWGLSLGAALEFGAWDLELFKPPSLA
jgi:hypothetical protein